MMVNNNNDMGVTSVIMPKSELDSINAKRKSYGITWAFLVRRGMIAYEEDVKNADILRSKLFDKNKK